MDRVRAKSSAKLACIGIILAFPFLLAPCLEAALVQPGRTSPPSKQIVPQSQDDDVVRVNSDLVVLNATVIDKDGKFVSGLKRGDFQILEDGKEQKLSSFSAEETPFAAAI